MTDKPIIKPNVVEPWAYPQQPPKKVPSKLEKLLEELEEESKEATAPVRPNSKVTFNVERVMNGYIVSCGGKYWVCPDDRDVMDVIKMALADAHL